MKATSFKTCQLASKYISIGELIERYQTALFVGIYGRRVGDKVILCSHDRIASKLQTVLCRKIEIHQQMICLPLDGKVELLYNQFKGTAEKVQYLSPLPARTRGPCIFIWLTISPYAAPVQGSWSRHDICGANMRLIIERSFDLLRGHDVKDGGTQTMIQSCKHIF